MSVALVVVAVAGDVVDRNVKAGFHGFTVSGRAMYILTNTMYIVFQTTFMRPISHNFFPFPPPLPLPPSRKRRRKEVSESKMVLPRLANRVQLKKKTSTREETSVATVWLV